MMKTRFHDDARGTAAVEFALVVPILVMFYFAIVELSLLLAADRKVTAVAAALGDLVAQTDKTNGAEIDAIFNAADAIMDPLDAGGMELRVTAMRMDSDGDVIVMWSRARNVEAVSCSAEPETPAGVLSPGQSVIFAEVNYTYASPLGEFVAGPVRLRDQFYLRPRQSLEVTFSPAMCAGA